jgi:hypothetical protein
LPEQGDQNMPAAYGTPLYWRDRAEEARTRAEGMTDPDARSAMVMVAENYERLARWSEEREAALRRSRRKDQ